MAAYNAGGSLVWSAALNATQFNSGIQSMVAQMAYAQRASQGLSASLSSIATITFAAVVGGIASITAAIYVATKAAADWETQMMSIARVSIDNFDYSTPQGKEQFRQLSRANQEIYMNVPLKNGTESLIKAQEPFALAGFTGKALTDLTEQLLKFSTDINYAVSEENIANAIVKSAQINRGEVEALGGGDYQKGVVEYSKKYLDTVLALSNKYTISPADLIKASTDAAGSATISGNLNNTDRQLAMYTLLNQYGVRPDIMRTMMTSSFSTAGLAGESTARIETALNRIGVATEQTVKGATGKDKTKKIKYSRAQIAGYLLGVSEDRFRSMIETDAYGTQIQLIDAIEKLDVDRLSKNALGAGLFGSYAGRETSKLAGGDALSVYEEINKLASSAWESGGQVQSQYENSLLELNKQWGLMGQRAYTIKELLGEIVIDPVKSGVKHFSEGLKGAAQWLTKIVDGSRNIDGTVNTWEAIGKVIDGIKSKIPKDAFKIAVSLVGAALVISNLNTIKTAAGVAVGALLKMSGITLSPLLGPITTLVGALGTIGIAAVAVAVGLGAIGYALNPEKFTYFNQLATEAINGVSVVVKQLYTDLSTGDWSAAATHLKDAFMATIVWLQGIDWGRLGGEIVTMIGDGAYALINGTLNLGGWIYDSLSAWVNGGGPYALGESIANFISSGLKTLGNVDYWAIIKGAFKAVGDWINLGWDIISGIGSGVLSGVSSSFAPAAHSIVEVFYTAVYSIEGAFARLWNTLLVNGVNIANQIGTAFAGIGRSLDGAVTTILDKVDTLQNNIPGLSSSSKSSGSNKHPSGDYDDSQTSVKAKEASSTYTPPSTDYAHSSTTINKDQSIESINRNNISLSPEAEAAAKAKTNAYKKPVGYMTGGEGIISDELKPVYDESGKISAYIMTNLRGQPITVSGHEQWSVENMQKYGKYLMEYETDPRGAAKIRADELVPLKTFPNEVKKSSDEAAKITTSGATTSVNILKDGIFESTMSFKDATKESTDYSTRSIASYSDFVNATSKQTAIETSNITRESYGAVRAGLSDSGKNIAVIGKVAQQQFETSGGKWVNDTISAGSTFNGDTTAGGTNAKNSMSEGGDIFVSKVGSLNFKTSDDGSVKTLGDYINELKSSSTSSTNSVKTLGEYINELKSQKTGSNVDSSQLLREVEDITCTGDRVMINTGIYTSPTGEKSAFNPMDNDAVRNITGNLEGEFQDMTCMGKTVTINGLKYTNPYGVTSYINPTEYNSGGGVLDYQQQGNILTGAAKDAGKISVDSAKTSSEYQKGSTNYQAQAIEGTTQRWVTTNEYMMAKEENAAIQNGEMWRNNVDYFTTSTDATYFRFDKMTDENIKQAYDYMGSEATVNDKKYQQNMETIKLYEAQISGMTGVNSQLAGLVSSIDSAGANLNASFGSMLASLSASMGNSSGAFGGTSVGGGGGWVGTGATNPANAVPWGGTAASIIAQMNSNMPRFGSVSWGAKGSLIEEPTRLIAGEKGRELLLPNNLTELFMRLAALGFNNVNGNGGSGDTVVIVNIDGEQVEKVVSRRQKRNLNLKGLKLH